MSDDAAVRLGERLAAIYRAEVEPRMRDLPLYNPALTVQAVGFRANAGLMLGILVTPWFMNIVRAQLSAEFPLPPARRGDLLKVRLPAGDFEFVVGEIEGFGRLDAASLYSPMFEFTDPEATRIGAEAAMAAILDDGTLAPPPATLDRRAMLFGWRKGAEVGG